MKIKKWINKKWLKANRFYIDAKDCDYCVNRGTSSCPNSKFCYATIDRLHFEFNKNLLPFPEVEHE